MENVEIMVLDEADRMLDESFVEQIAEVSAKCPSNRQNLLFTATISDEIEKMLTTNFADQNFGKVNLSASNEVTQSLAQKFVKIKTTQPAERENALICISCLLCNREKFKTTLSINLIC